MAVSCSTDSRFDAEGLTDVSLSIKLFEAGVEFPVGEIEPITPASFGLDSYPIKDETASYGLDIPSEVRTALKAGPVGIKGAFQSTIPYTITLTIEYLDASGNSFDLNTESSTITIPPGDSEITFLIRARSSELVSGLECLKLNFVLHADGSPQPVGENDCITGRLSAFFPEGLNINPDE
ncbi:MAG: hypothetical protein ACI4TJ_02735 [Candidatus Cryptobacteroides sp.]